MSSFSDLPEELLRVIYEYLDENSLIALACLNHRLNSSALPAYFASSPETEKLNTNGSLTISSDSHYHRKLDPDPMKRVLRGLRLSLASRSLRKLHLRIGVPGTSLVTQFTSCCLLLDQFTSITEVVMEFQRAYGFKYDAQTDDWRLPLQTTARKLATKGCTALTLIRPDYLLTCRVPGYPTTAAQEDSKLKRFMKNRLRSGVKPITPVPSLFVLQCTEPLIQQVISLLNSSSLESFTFQSYGDYLQPSAYGDLLGGITFTKLTNLSLITDRLSSQDVDRFVSRHKHLTSLHLHDIRILPHVTESPSELPPSLTDLTGAPSILLHLLANPNTLPCLKHVRILHYVPSKTSDPVLDITTSLLALEPIALRLLGLVLTLRIHHNPPTWFPQNKLLLIEPPHSKSRLIGGVKRIELAFRTSENGLPTPREWAPWLACFPYMTDILVYYALAFALPSNLDALTSRCETIPTVTVVEGGPTSPSLLRQPKDDSDSPNTDIRNC